MGSGSKTVKALALLLLTAAGFIRSQPPAPASNAAAELQQEGMLLWIAGDYYRAIETMRRLYADFQAEQRGRAAYFHIANKLENIAIIEADSLARAREILEAARDYYDAAAHKTPGQGKVALDRSIEGLARTQAKIDAIDAIARNPGDFRKARADLSGMDADLAAVEHLRSRLGLVPADDPEITFYILIHWVQYLDGLQQRLVEIHTQFASSRGDLFEFGNTKYAGMAAVSADAAAVFAHEAIERHPRSRWILEYHVYAGDAHRYAALARIAQRDALVRRQDAAGAARLAREITREAAAGALQNRMIIAKSEAFIALEAGMTAPYGHPPPNLFSLRRYRSMSRERVMELQALAGSRTDEGIQ